MFDTPREYTCEEFRQYDDGKPTPCYAATYYGLRDADAYSRNKGESIYSAIMLGREERELINDETENEFSVGMRSLTAVARPRRLYTGIRARGEPR